MKHYMLAFLIGTSLSSSVFAVNFSSISILSEGKVSQKYLQEIRVDSGSYNGEKIWYGHPVYGEFLVNLKHLKKDRNKLIIKFLPPGYKKEISFWYVKKNGDQQMLGKKSFKNPTPDLFNHYLKLHLEKAKFSTPFLLLVGSIPDKTREKESAEKKSLNFVFAVNRIGEIVWLHVPSKGQYVFRKPLVVKQLGDGLIGILAGGRESYFELVDFSGAIKGQLRAQDTIRPFVMQADFLVEGGKDLLVFSQQQRFIRDPQNLLSRPQPFLASRLLKIAPKQRLPHTVHDSIDTFNPYLTISDKKFAEEKVFFSWGQPKSTGQYTYYSSLQSLGSDGYLVADRNLGKVFQINQQGQLQWEFQNKLQHVMHAQSLPDGEILVYDNNQGKVRVQIIDRADASKKFGVKWNYSPKDSVFSPKSGSAVSMKDGRILIYYLAQRHGETLCVVEEVDRKSKDVLSQISYAYENYSPMVKAFPMSQISF